MNTVDILVKGRNRALLFEKFRRARVDILRAEESDFDIIIRVKYKDLKKAFTIMGDMWYNKPIRYNGFIGIVHFLKVHLFLSVAVIAFIIGAFFVDNYVLFFKTTGASTAKSAAIASLLTDLNIKSFSKVDRQTLDKLENEILKSDQSYSFVTAKKVANTLVIEVKEKREETAPKERKEFIAANHSGVITSVSVLRGRAVKSVGDTVLAGETVIEGVLSDDEREYKTYAVGYFTISCESVFETATKDDTEDTARAYFNSIKEFLSVDSAECAYQFTPAGGGYALKLTITYSITENGGTLE